MKHNLISFSDLNLTDRFLFDEVMEDPQTHQDALSIIFGHPVPLLGKNETEKELRVSPNVRSVRMDVFSMDEEKSIYNTEMQKKKQSDLAKRSRYYQSMIDTSLLEPGIPDYNVLNKSYIIIITPFDLFGYGLYCYTFHTCCKERPDCILDDGATRIFLNTHGTNDSEVTKELVDFLHYLEHTTEQAAISSGSDRIKRIHNRVCKVKSNEEIGVKYMQAWEEKYYERQEGREEGLKEGLEKGLQKGLQKGSTLKLIQQVMKKLERGKAPDTIADELEEELSDVISICNAAETFAPDYDCERIYEYLCEENIG